MAQNNFSYLIFSKLALHSTSTQGLLVNDDDRIYFFITIIYFLLTCFCSPVSRIFQVVYGMSWYGMSWYDVSWYDVSMYDVSLMDVSFGMLSSSSLVFLLSTFCMLLLLLFSSSFLPLVFMLQEKKEKKLLI
jgi:hypothetical protein